MTNLTNVFLLVVVVVATAMVATSAAPAVSTHDPHRIFVVVFTESMCPCCVRFVHNQLYPHYEALESIIDLVLPAYGNAETIQHDNGTKEIRCQHGERECRGNIWENCAQDVVRDMKKFMPFLECFGSELMRDRRTDVDEIGKKCAAEVKYSKTEKLIECATGPIGQGLHEDAGFRTEEYRDLIPGVPTVLFNLKPTSDGIYRNFVREVCHAYKGHHVPEICKKYLQ